MPLNLLHLDDALLSQLAFRQQCIGLGAHESELRDIGPDVRLWARNDVVELVRKRLSVELSDLATDEPQLTWIGSGDFHHITALLVELLTEARRTRLTIVQFDNHPDWVAPR